MLHLGSESLAADARELKHALIKIYLRFRGSVTSELRHESVFTLAQAKTAYCCEQ
jgi:hypothetical protein